MSNTDNGFPSIRRAILWSLGIFMVLMACGYLMMGDKFFQ